MIGIRRNYLKFRHTIWLVIIAMVLLSVLGCNAKSEIKKPPLRILFIGNSYTFTTNIPLVFTELAKSGGHPIETGIAADKGGAFSDYASSSIIHDKIKSTKWDYVILQEQSQLPSVEELRVEEMYPAARRLVDQIKAAGSVPLFFLTSANRDGWPENGLNDYESMQLQINQGYLDIAKELNTPVAPVGYVWSEVMKENPQLELWVDGRHPNKQGAYLAACVFYSVIFRENPEGLKYAANVPEETAHFLQAHASRAVLNNLIQWNLM